MLKILLFCWTITLVSCSDNSNKSSQSSQQKIKIDTVIKPYHFDCFKSVDTTKQMDTKGCGNYFYKIVDKKYVLVLQTNISIQYDTCIQIHIDTTISNVIAQLIIYKDGEATLFQYCNDYGNGVYPIKTLTKAFGDIYVKFYKPTEHRGTDKPTASIFVHNLTFIDSSNNSHIKIDNELFWKVYQVGPAG